MTFATRFRLFSTAVAATLVLAQAPAWAQEISDEHLKAARAALAAIKATDPFDSILPAAASVLKQDLIRNNPDLQDTIVKTVDEKALELAPRRLDLEKEAATSYARVFSQDDLNAIATFYNSPAGKKLISDGPIVLRELGKAAGIWQRGVARDLAEAVDKALEPQMPKAAAQPAAEAPAQPAQPADDASGAN